MAASHFLKGGIEAFDVADLQKRAVFLRQTDEVFGLGDREGQRLFDQDRNAATKEFAGDRSWLEVGTTMLAASTRLSSGQ